MTGSKYIEVVDRSRKETLNTEKDDFRRLKVCFYYPGEDDPKKEPIRLVDEDALKEVHIKDPDLTCYDQRIRVCDDLKIKEGCFPLILYSHGYGCPAEQNSDLCSYLADRGYVVASIAHTCETSELTFEDGTRIGFSETIRKMKPSIPSLLSLKLLLKLRLNPEKALEHFDRYQHRYDPFMMERIEEWRKDDLFVLSVIHDMTQKKDSFLYQRIDFSHGVGATGHSFGGAAAYCHCLNDDEISCGINMDGALYGEHLDKVNHKPFMQFSSREPDNFITRVFFFHDAPLHYISFKDINHMGFTDLKLITDRKALVGTSDPIKTMDTINEAHLAFFDRYLKQGDTKNRSRFDINESMLMRYDVL